jgi:hypothetical protein
VGVLDVPRSISCPAPDRPKENGILGQKFKKGGSGSFGQRCCGKRTLGRD